MARPNTIRLREAKGAVRAPNEAVIDADFKEVGLKRRTIVGRLWIAVVTVFWAAVIGFLIPPAWVVMQELGAMFAPVR
jgi:hypothetical protein